MKTEIEVLELEADKVEINGKVVRRDMNGNWTADEELGRAEYIAFKRYLKSIS